ncbi:TPA: DUF2612 domain-containing protein [Haemophilus influenzae]|uniref:DUF2612 domain-containing protein n=1 Tax=Haemophilus influenzae TaxID=727 RepID=UPI003F793A3B
MKDILTALNDDFKQLGRERLLSQFNYSPNLNAFLSLLLLPHHEIQATLKQMLTERHIDTAIEKQLDGVGDIVGMPRPFARVNGDWYFGFSGQSKAKPFSRAPIRDLATQTNSRDFNYMLDEHYRRLIKWKVIANHSHGTLDDVIEACRAIFLAERVSITEGQDADVHITITRMAKNRLDAVEQEPVLWIPTAAGVKVTVEFINA